MIEKILKMTVEEFLLAVAKMQDGATDAPASGTKEEVAVAKHPDVLGAPSAVTVEPPEKPAALSCLRCEHRRGDVTAMIERIMEKATSAAVINCCVEGFSITITKLLAIIGEVLYMKRIFKKDYNLNDYVSMINSIKGYESITYKTMARELATVRKLFKQGDTRALAIRRSVMKWMTAPPVLPERGGDLMVEAD